MSPEEKQQLKVQISENIEQLRSDISGLEKEINPISPDVAIGRLSRMEAIGEKSVKEELLRSSQARLAKLEKTLEEIDGDEFGKCIKCGADIPLARVQAVPESGKCINCA